MIATAIVEEVNKATQDIDTLILLVENMKAQVAAIN